MCSFTICVIALLATLVLTRPVDAEEIDQGGALGEPLCQIARAAASQEQLERETQAHLPGIDSFSFVDSDRSERITPASPLGGHRDRELFESSLRDWRFYRDLAHAQQAIILGLVARCGVPASPKIAAVVFSSLNASQRGTFVGITHALMHTVLVRRADGRKLGNALTIIETVLDIRGENASLPSDKQFQIIVQVPPGSEQKLEGAAGFERGENHYFHKGYPVSFRQSRRLGVHGQEAGLHVSFTQDGRRAEIHIDYRFGLLHLMPANSDIRADGNRQRHVDRWPQVAIVMREVAVPHAVLEAAGAAD